MTSIGNDANVSVDNKVTDGSSIVLQPFVLELFDRIAGDEGFTDYTVVPSSGSKHGDNFMGIMVRVLLKGIRNGHASVLSLMLKMPPLSEARRKQFNSARLFEREAYMYETVLPTFVRFQCEKGIRPENGFFAFPRCYGIVADTANDNYAIVMEDLKEKGYDMFNKFNSIDIAHVRFMMEELARFHAVSFALRDQRPDIFAPFTQMSDLFLEMMQANREMMMSFQDRAFESAMAALDAGESELKAKVEDLRSRFEEHMDACVRSNVAEPFCVINHGDCWNNNMMYLYRDGSPEPKHMCLIDFQISRWASPVLDIVYFLFTSTEKSLRDAHFDEILHIYHDALSTAIRRMGSDPERLFGYDDFIGEMRKFGRYGVLIAPMLVQVVTADPTDIPDMDVLADEMAKNGHNDMQMFISTKTQMAYNRRIGDVIRDAERLGYL